MKNKLITFLTCAMLFCCCVFGLSACGTDNNTNADNKNQEILGIYNMYVAHAEENGKQPLNYEEWLESIKGKDGINGKDGVSVIDSYINEDGDLIIVLSNESEINAGNVVEKAVAVESSIRFKTLTVNGNGLYLKVPDSVVEFDFKNEIDVVGNAKYEISFSEYGIGQVLTKKIPLNIGNNHIYIFEFDGDEIVEIYSVNIYRQPIYTVSFETYTTSIDSQKVFEGEFAEIPTESLSFDGYTFMGWDFDFSSPITESLTIKAIWKSNYYTYNDTHHWYSQYNGETKFNYTEHKSDGGKCACGKYLDASSALTYTKTTIDGELAYEVTLYDKDSSIVHVEIPAYYKGAGDEKALPVLVIAEGCFKASGLKSIKLNEGLRYINRTAFCSTNITEIDIPDSVLGQQTSIYPYSGGLYNTFSECNELVSVKIGNGITIIESHTFASCKNLSNVVLGENVQKIGIRAFYECKSLKEIVLPASLNYIPEGEVYTPAVDKVVALNRCFTYASKIYMNITKEELIALTVPLYNRDEITGEVIADNIQRNPGFCEGWSGIADIYYKGEWKYDKDGKPVEL